MEEGSKDMNEKLEQLKQYMLAQGSLAVGLACMPWQRAPIWMTAGIIAPASSRSKSWAYSARCVCDHGSDRLPYGKHERNF